MKFGSKLLQRFYASSRSISASKGAKSELNFKENNDISNPYDILYRNVPGIGKRLSLFEMRRLKEQLELDRADLDAIKSMNHPISQSKNEDFRSDFMGIELSYTALSNFPGLNHPTASSIESSVTIRIPFESLKLCELERKKLLNFLKIDINSEYLEFIVSDFPLVSQNKNRAVEILNAVIYFIKNKNDSDWDQLSIFNSDSNNRPNKRLMICKL